MTKGEAVGLGGRPAGEGSVAGRYAAGELMEFAREVALGAGELTLSHFGDALAAETKADGTPVTRADREAEAFLREEIGRRFPGHSILGEEFGEEPGDEPVRWILDPIDGTRSFMKGVPLYAVLVGVEIAGAPAAGVVHLPALGETVAAAHGEGCRWWPSGGAPPREARVSDTGMLRDATALVTDPRALPASPIGVGWAGLSREVSLVRGWGDAYGHILVATGRAEIMVDPVLSLWDAAPLLPVVTEAGGRFTDLEGRPTVRGGSGVSTNGRLHSAVLRRLAGRG